MRPQVIDRGDRVPTVVEMLGAALAAKRDRVVMVREPAPGLDAGVAILLIGPVAIMEIGPYLKEHVAKLAQHPASERVGFSNTESLKKVMEAHEKMGWEWSYGLKELDGTECILVIVVGPSVTKEFAAELTKRGAVTNLK